MKSGFEPIAVGDSDGRNRSCNGSNRVVKEYTVVFNTDGSFSLRVWGCGESLKLGLGGLEPMGSSGVKLLMLLRLKGGLSGGDDSACG